MLTAYLRALDQLLEPRIVRLIGYAMLLSLLVFAVLWGGIAWLLTHTEVTSFWLLEKILDALGSIATVVSTFFLFPIVVSTMVGFYLEAVARAVEARHYPDVTPAPGIGVVAGVYASLRFLLKAGLVNLVLLLVLLIPVLYPFAWFAANSYLLSREYFELVALRRLDLRGARDLRRRHRVQLLLGGLGAVALFAIPVVNLMAPVVVTMAMVHVCERWRAKPPPAGAVG
jgi:CysZ protein